MYYACWQKGLLAAKVPGSNYLCHLFVTGSTGEILGPELLVTGGS